MKRLLANNSIYLRVVLFFLQTGFSFSMDTQTDNSNITFNEVTSCYTARGMTLEQIKSLENNTTYTELLVLRKTNNIWDEGMSPAEIVAFTEGLKKNTTLISLGFRWGRMGTQEEMLLMAEALKVNTTLTCFEISYDSVTFSGAKALAEALKENKSLTTLRLYGSKIDDKGAEAFAKMLKVNTTLTRLDIQSNEITSEGAQLLCDVLKTENNTLKVLDLRGNSRIKKDIKDLYISELKERVVFTGDCIKLWGL